MIVQIYEIQTPREAEAMIALGVDHIGSVMLDPLPASRFDIKQTIRTVQQAGRKSSLIPLFNDVDAISKMVEALRPDMLHLCEALGSVEKERDGVFTALDRQRKLRERFPDIELMRSIPIGQPGNADQ
jgi:phosphoribosylanthranilate isomerase